MLYGQQRRQFKNRPNHFWLILFISCLILFLGIYLSLLYGAKPLTVHELLTALKAGPSSNIYTILFTVRLPRICAAILVGASLALSGSIMQAVTRNPIADPGLLGINAGAALALSLAYAIWPHLHYSLIIIISMIGSTLACLLVFTLSYQKGKGYQQMRLILSGAMVAMLLSAIGQALINYFHLATAIIGWQAGGLVGVNWKMLSFIAPIIIFSVIILYCLAYQLSILSLAEEKAKSLGQSTVALTLIFLAIVLLLSSASVSLAGNIAFVGLIIPHLTKRFIPNNYQQALPIIGILGAAFIVWVDLFCRTLHPPYETPITAVISILGFPVLLWLVRKAEN
ncbi:FecCD family ABC transporter permease [Streptococcus hongkongensis]|nr:ferrichrome ABC transporter permease [Streptococcus uberis]